ncbi:hypothetical protein C8J57DRAFT_1558677 [Mycena rebaudengoi]|nr:hypothetical protein C8J57DRAFT_1558677 [Mycena rebaudengoi]
MPSPTSPPFRSSAARSHCRRSVHALCAVLPHPSHLYECPGPHIPLHHSAAVPSGDSIRFLYWRPKVVLPRRSSTPCCIDRRPPSSSENPPPPASILRRVRGYLRGRLPSTLSPRPPPSATLEPQRPAWSPAARASMPGCLGAPIRCRQHAAPDRQPHLLERRIHPQRRLPARESPHHPHIAVPQLPAHRICNDERTLSPSAKSTRSHFNAVTRCCCRRTSHSPSSPPLAHGDSTSSRTSTLPPRDHPTGRRICLHSTLLNRAAAVAEEHPRAESTDGADRRWRWWRRGGVRWRRGGREARWMRKEGADNTSGDGEEED